jgi:MFS family permease
LKSIEVLYKKEDCFKVITQLKRKIEATNRLTTSLQGVKLMNRKNLLSFHLALLRQFCGVTFIIIYARQIMNDLGSNLANETPVIVNSIQLGAGILGVFLVSRFQRRKMIIYSTLALAILIFIIGITDLLELSIPCLISMTIFMIPCGTGLNSVIWSYPSELASPAQGKYGSLISWGGAAIVTLVPPYILNAMPDHSAYPIFFFFAFYLIGAFLINYMVLVEVE